MYSTHVYDHKQIVDNSRSCPSQIESLKTSSKVIDYDFKQSRQLMVEVLEFLRSRNVSYETAKFILEGAQDILKQVVRHELGGLPLAAGITCDAYPDQLITASKRLDEKSNPDHIEEVYSNPVFIKQYQKHFNTIIRVPLDTPLLKTIVVILGQYLLI